jgi:hypothetical protein
MGITEVCVTFIRSSAMLIFDSDMAAEEVTLVASISCCFYHQLLIEQLINHD